MLKINKVYNLALQKPWNHLVAQKINRQTNNGQNALSLELVEVALVQCNLVDNQYQRNSEVLYTFAPNKSYAYLLNFEPSNLVFLKT